MTRIPEPDARIYGCGILSEYISERQDVPSGGLELSSDDPDGELTLSGVVYNEMKGAFSSPEGVLEPCDPQFPFPGYILCK